MSMISESEEIIRTIIDGQNVVLLSFSSLISLVLDSCRMS